MNTNKAVQKRKPKKTLLVGAFVEVRSQCDGRWSQPMEFSACHVFECHSALPAQSYRTRLRSFCKVSLSPCVPNVSDAHVGTWHASYTTALPSACMHSLCGALPFPFVLLAQTAADGWREGPSYRTRLPSSCMTSWYRPFSDCSDCPASRLSPACMVCLILGGVRSQHGVRRSQGFSACHVFECHSALPAQSYRTRLRSFCMVSLWPRVPNVSDAHVGVRLASYTTALPSACMHSLCGALPFPCVLLAQTAADGAREDPSYRTRLPSACMTSCHLPFSECIDCPASRLSPAYNVCWTTGILRSP